MSCSNCYNGCPQITSDQCVRYTGIDVPVLGIKNGDSLSYVEQAIITFLTSTLDGTGVKPKIEKSIICDTVKKYLPTCGDLSVVDFTKALIQAVCELKTLINGNVADIKEINDFITSLESAYNVDDCLTGVISTSGTHNILQAVITRLCAFIRDANSTFVKTNDIEDVVNDLISENPVSTKYYYRMIPFVAVPFFPTSGILANFNSGVGQGDWEQIYFCNGANNTPDLRGRVPVGATDGTMLGGLLPTQTNPAEPGGFNPTYVKGTPLGNNSITLIKDQIPSHNHPGSNIVVELNDPGHSHSYNRIGNVTTTGNAGIEDGESINPAEFGAINSRQTGITVSKQQLTIVPEGGNKPHSNVQPGMGCYYIMHIPS